MIAAAAAIAEAIARQSAVALLAGVAYALPVAAVAWLIVRMCPRANAATRYGIWSAALIATILLDPLPGHRFFGFVPVQAAHAAAAFVPSLPLAPEWALGLFIAWYAIATVLIIRLIVGHLSLQRIKDRASPLAERHKARLAPWFNTAGSRRVLRLLASSDIDTPLAIGLLHPAIVLPKQLVEQLGDDDVDQICLHELAHLQRGDDWTNLAQKVAEALLFFSPAVHIIAREMSIEREIACDDWVVAATGKARTYATCLTRLAELASLKHRIALPSLGAFVTRKQIFIRIERLLDRTRVAQPGIALGASWAACAVLMTLLAAEAQLAPLVTIAPARDVVAAQRIISVPIADAARPPAARHARAAGLVAVHRHEVVSMCLLMQSRAHRVAHAAVHAKVGAVTLKRDHRRRVVASSPAGALSSDGGVGAGSETRSANLHVSDAPALGH